jgi:M6 family metalloprotease-like protein
MNRPSPPALGLLALAALACARSLPATPAALGPDTVLFRGSTVSQNKFDTYEIDRCPARETPSPLAGAYTPAGDPPLNVLALLVDPSDQRYGGTAAELTAFATRKQADYETNTNSYWSEASYSDVSVHITMPDRLTHLAGTFDDYFNASFRPVSLTTSGLAGRLPARLVAPASATLSVHACCGRTTDVVFAPNATFTDMPALVAACQAAFDAVPSMPRPWVTCSDQGGELRMRLADGLVRDGSYIRVRTGTDLAAFHLEGPVETPGTWVPPPGTPVPATLAGKPVTYPIALAGTEEVRLTVRNRHGRRRSYAIRPGAGAVATPAELAARLLPTINAEAGWVEAYDAGAGRLGLRLFADQSDQFAAIYVTGGTGLAALGLDGPVRIDGLVSQGATDSVRGDWARTVGEALSLYVRSRAETLGVPIDAAHEADLAALVERELRGFDAFAVMFLDPAAGAARKRAGESAGVLDVSLAGAGGYTFTRQLEADYMIGQTIEPWQTWAHEMGHALRFVDLYFQPIYDVRFGPMAYARAWSMMDLEGDANHVDAWHKYKARWFPSAAVADVLPPGPGETRTDRFTLAPLEYPFSEYAGIAAAGTTARQVVRIQLSQHHWILLENRQPGRAHSLALPEDQYGLPSSDYFSWTPRPGGLLMTDTVDPDTVALFRAPVTVLNPAAPPFGSTGRQSAPGLNPPRDLPLTTTFPAYAGISVNVSERVPGPAGRPDALAVEVTRGPGDWLDLEIRPWRAPEAYATPDIWVDWPGDGTQDFPGDPPVGNVEPTHWSEGSGVVNLIKVRVHNRGTVDARGVVVRASVNLPMGLGDRGRFSPLPDSAPQDIPAGRFTDFAFEWRPAARGHTCLRAEIVTHASTLGDLDLANNAAQENINDFHPTAGSPYAPVPFSFTLTNDSAVVAEAELRVKGLPPGMNVELERRYLTVEPRETVTVAGRLFVDETVIPPGPALQRACGYRFNLLAFRRTQDGVMPWGGITVRVHPGFGARLRSDGLSLDNRGVVVRGALEGRFPANQKIDAALVGSDGRMYGGATHTDAGGDFVLSVGRPPRGPGQLMLYYFGPDLSPAAIGPLAVTVP